MKFKKILATVLSGVLALSIVGCGSKGDTSSNDDKKIVVGIEGTYKNGKILYAVVLDIRG